MCIKASITDQLLLEDYAAGGFKSMPMQLSFQKY